MKTRGLWSYKIQSRRGEETGRVLWAGENFRHKETAVMNADCAAESLVRKHGESGLRVTVYGPLGETITLTRRSCWAPEEGK